MDSQIEGYVLQATSITQDLPGVVGGLSQAQFNWQPGHGRWSIGQCVAHLNITLERYLPVLGEAMSAARSSGRVAQGPFTYSLFERWFIRSLEPPVRLRFKTPKAFVGAPDLDLAATLAQWQELHRRFADCLLAAEGLDRKRITVRSQFGPVSFSLGGTVGVLLAHERRHLWQAREVRKDAEFPRE